VPDAAHVDEPAEVTRIDGRDRAERADGRALFARLLARMRTSAGAHRLPCFGWGRTPAFAARDGVARGVVAVGPAVGGAVRARGDVGAREAPFSCSGDTLEPPSGVATAARCAVRARGDAADLDVTGRTSAVLSAGGGATDGAPLSIASPARRHHSDSERFCRSASATTRALRSCVMRSSVRA
jgi:hypothetical protein